MNEKKLSVNGFTLLELLLYTALFAVIAGSFVAITTIVTRVETREVSSLEVSNQLTFVMQTVQRLVSESSVIIVNADGSADNDSAPLGNAYPYLVLRMKDSTGSASDRDPIVIWKDSATGAIKIRQGSGSNQTTDTLTTTKVENIANILTFVKRTNYPGPDVVQINLSLAANTANPQSAVTRSLQTAVSRVSAASFDSSLVPGADNSYNFGTAGNRWRDAFFSGIATFAGNVGIGTTNPVSKLEVKNGYLQFSDFITGVPNSADCNSDTQMGRVILSTNNRLYVCAGASRGWDYTALTN